MENKRQTHNNTQRGTRSDVDPVSEFARHFKNLDQEKTQLKRERDNALQEKEQKDRILKTTERENQMLQTQVQESQQQHQRKDNQLKKLQTDVDQLTQGKKEVESRLRANENECKKLKREADDNKTIMESQEQSIKDLQYKLQHIQKEHEVHKYQIGIQEEQFSIKLKQQEKHHREERATQEKTFREEKQKLEHTITQQSRQVRELDQAVNKSSHENQWREGRFAPCTMVRDTDAVVNGSVAYFRPRDTKQVHAFDSISESWTQLPDCLYDHTTLTVVNGLLTTVGGQVDNASTNQIFSLTGEGSGRKWSEIFPPMPTSRSHTVVVNVPSALVVAGGWTKKRFTDGRPLTTVEIMSTSSPKWCTASELPAPLFSASATVCLDHIYILGNASDCVLQSNIPALITSCNPQIFATQLVHGPTTKVWFKIALHPLSTPTCYTFNNHLFVVGKDTARAEYHVCLYDYDYNSWQHIDTLQILPPECFVVVLHSNLLMVVNGRRVQFKDLTRLEPRRFV